MQVTPAILVFSVAVIIFIIAAIVIVNIQVKNWRKIKAKVASCEHDDLREGYATIMRLEKLSSALFAGGMLLLAIWLIGRFVFHIL